MIFIVVDFFDFGFKTLMNKLLKSSLIIVPLLLSGLGFSQQSTYTCANEINSYLIDIVGEWEVETKDRISPGNYESNKGASSFSVLIEGCGIQESFRGVFKGKPYAREVLIMGKDSVNLEMSVIDSEHGSFSILKGSKVGDQLELIWYRDIEVKRLQSKYILSKKDKDQIEFSSYLSTDYGENWSLTHQRNYTRKKQ